MNPAVEFVGVTKRYPGLVANADISFPVFPGEIHAVVGENGAGKSTLMNILAGFVAPDAGRVVLFGKTRQKHTPRAALAAGVGFCAQHFHLVPTLTGMQNILLGKATARPFAPLSRTAQEKVRELMKRYGLRTNLDVPVSDLSIGESERVEILKLLYGDAKVLILDEPTAVLAPTEVESLFTVLRQLRKEGKAVLFVSHKLPEVLAIADRVTVLRGGRVIGTVAAAGLEASTLVSMIVGGEAPVEVAWQPKTAGEPVLEVEKLSAGRRTASLQRVSFRVREGEIVGIGGVEGNGQRELVHVLMGYLSRDHGEIRFLGRPMHPERTPAFRRRIGVIPEDRRREGLLLSRGLVENAALGQHDRKPIRKGIWLDRAEMVAQARRIVEKFDVQPPRIDLKARAYSGGNQQKFIAGRELSRRPPFLLAVHPTRGVDLRATQFIHAQLLEERERGTAILLVTADLAELRALSDRILILYRGRVAYEATREAVDGAELHRSLLGLEAGKVTAGA